MQDIDAQFKALGTADLASAQRVGTPYFRTCSAEEAFTGVIGPMVHQIFGAVEVSSTWVLMDAGANDEELILTLPDGAIHHPERYGELEELNRDDIEGGGEDEKIEFKIHIQGGDESDVVFTAERANIKGQIDALAESFAKQCFAMRKNGKARCRNRVRQWEMGENGVEYWCIHHRSDNRVRCPDV